MRPCAKRSVINLPCFRNPAAAFYQCDTRICGCVYLVHKNTFHVPALYTQGVGLGLEIGAGQCCVSVVDQCHGCNVDQNSAYNDREKTLKNFLEYVFHAQKITCTVLTACRRRFRPRACSLFPRPREFFALPKSRRGATAGYCSTCPGLCLYPLHREQIRA